MLLQRLTRFALLVALALGGSALARAQGFTVERRNPPSAAQGADTFTSLDARFSVALPQQIAGFQAASYDTPQGKVNVGDAYMWRVAETRYEITCLDKKKLPGAASADSREVLRTIAERAVADAPAAGGKVLHSGEVTASGHPGREVRIELPTAYGLYRAFATDERIYLVIAMVPKDPQALAAADKVLDSFRVLTAAEAEAAMRKRVAEATPSPLPQEPADKRPKSDAEDDGLKGRVKTVFTESEDLSGKWSRQGRKPAAMEHYNERGNLTRRDSYDHKGNPYSVTVYGYIGGERVSLIKNIEQSYNAPAVVVAAPPGAAPRKDDPRYTYKFKYKYDAGGRLIEKVWYMSHGALWLRYVYNYDGRQKETLVYSADGSLNQKYLYTLDDRDNVVEYVVFDPKNDSVKSKTSYAYEFDAQGNWTKRTASEWGVRDGKEGLHPSHIHYRTITYY